MKNIIKLFLDNSIILGCIFFLIFLFLSFIFRKKYFHRYLYIISFIILTITSIEFASYIFFNYNLHEYYIKLISEKIEDNQSKNNLVFRHNDENTYGVSQDYHRLLGYIYKPNDEIISSRSMVNIESGEETLIYSVKYTTNDFGLRYTPHLTSERKHCIYFFGGSFTFGEGVNDNETLPYFVGIISGYKVINFGYHGWGAHHMLAIIENNIFFQNGECKKNTLVYQGGNYHIDRAACLMNWDYGPMYSLSDDYSAFRIGSCKVLGDAEEIFGMWPYNLRHHLYTIKAYENIFHKPRKSLSEKKLLYKKILTKTVKLGKQKKITNFVLLNWKCNESDELFKDIEQQSEWRLLNTNLCSEKYTLSPHDGHPSPEAHFLNAKKIVELLSL